MDRTRPSLGPPKSGHPSHPDLGVPNVADSEQIMRIQAHLSRIYVEGATPFCCRCSCLHMCICVCVC